MNDAISDAALEAAKRMENCHRLMNAGVTIIDPAATYIDADVTVGAGTVIHPGSHLKGRTIVGGGCEIGPNSILTDAQVGDGSKILCSVVTGAVLEDRVEVGPFCHLRPGTYLETEVRVGTCGEVKNSRLGRRTQMHHFSYIGDAQIGENVNIGAGTITCNFDGHRKNETIVESGAFIGSDTMLVAPVRLGKGSSTGAGAVVIRDVPEGKLAVGVPARVRDGPRDAGQETGR